LQSKRKERENEQSWHGKSRSLNNTSIAPLKWIIFGSSPYHHHLGSYPRPIYHSLPWKQEVNVALLRNRWLCMLDYNNPGLHISPIMRNSGNNHNATLSRRTLSAINEKCRASRLRMVLVNWWCWWCCECCLPSRELPVHRLYYRRFAVEMPAWRHPSGSWCADA
jgi:hypothetical protein